MCGIVSILHLDNHSSPVERSTIERMRDRLHHRGPDDAGLWEGKQGSIGHRRLAVIDTSPAGHQPMVGLDEHGNERYILAYNGELYNDHELRSQLATLGYKFRSNCDSETLLKALMAWGTDALDKLRGMYSFLFLDTKTQTALIARDPLGIKPLYHTVVNAHSGRQLLIASEIPALLEHPDVVARPDPVTLSAYLSSVRTTLGERTMYENISTLTPGQCLKIPLAHPEQIESTCWWTTHKHSTPHPAPDSMNPEATQSIRQTIEDSVHRHLRTDVPICTLLSGGLDSAITTLLAQRSIGSLNTYCAGAKTEGFDDDFMYADQLARLLKTDHTEVELNEQGFVKRWGWMIEQLAVPLSTPNEVAIYEVAQTLRSAGHIVALSGEGADELFGGYAPIMQQATDHVASLNGKDDTLGGLFHLQSNAWISHELKPGILKEPWYAAANGDQYLRDHYTKTFLELKNSSGDDSPLQTHLRFQRRMNLPNLLQRLDTSTMLASVEGRTPFADIEVALAAESLGMDQKYLPSNSEKQQPKTKIALREALRDSLPQEIVNRPKASFPLPFQNWMSSLSDTLFDSPFAREVFSDQAIGLVCAQPAKYWHMSWPMLNLTLWGDRAFTGTHQGLEQDHTCSGS
jgi:asparagine synthase (glutamine-hydrolysing)